MKKILMNFLVEPRVYGWIMPLIFRVLIFGRWMLDPAQMEDCLLC